jgi:hypothetical protein
LLTHHSNNLLLESSDQRTILVQVWPNKHVGKERESDLDRKKQHHEQADDREGSLNNDHDPVNDSEDSQSSKQVEHIQDNDQSVHLVLLEEVVRIVNHLYVLFLIMTLVVIVQNILDVVIVGLLGQYKLDEEAQDHHDIGGNGASLAVARDFRSIVISDLQVTYSGEVAHAEE